MLHFLWINTLIITIIIIIVIHFLKLLLSNILLLRNGTVRGTLLSIFNTSMCLYVLWRFETLCVRWALVVAFHSLRRVFLAWLKTNIDQRVPIFVFSLVHCPSTCLSERLATNTAAVALFSGVYPLVNADVGLTWKHLPTQVTFIRFDLTRLSLVFLLSLCMCSLMQFEVI